MLVRLIAVNGYLNWRTTMGFFSRLYASKKLTSEQKMREKRELQTAQLGKFNGLTSSAATGRRGKISGSTSKNLSAQSRAANIFATTDQVHELQRNVGGVNALIIKNSLIRLTVYVYDPAPLTDVGKGESITAVRDDGCRSLTSKLNGSVWTRADGGTVFAYRGMPFGIVFSSKASGVRTIVMRRTGTYAHGIPEMVAEIQKPYELQDSHKYIPCNSKPTGLPELVAGKNVSISGEEDAQSILERFDEDSLIWVRVECGEIPKGKSKGKPTLIALIDDQQVGYLTELQESRYGNLIPSTGAICLGRVKLGSRKLEVELKLPRIDS